MNDTPSPENGTQAAGGAWRPRLKKLFRLQWEPAQDAHVLLYPEGMVKLNPSAAQILLRCDGTRDLPALVADLEQAFSTTGLAPEVQTFVDHAQTRGWLE
ncbi:pyrroloquinoline quinone biosynthesis peptide chaperone PqqD [Paraburkholderia sartisoli]|uniref:Pyrroloquinoline quinone biosynthesis protein D n=1 Tax=Paraburkholderia sartisoli TaxID=83784 RepID=A0A1H4A622_9BURK|nr:pyrroloquinoline quinone biosynthesis peptide chaperone PqqD [Paraburkholderia sartisoli]SEA31367.1 pyrroloquinoline quinone biosynthesis protein D [Paraburkholderia sartisoli]